MRILYICNAKIYNRKMSRVRFHGIGAIARAPGVYLVKSGPGWPNWPGAKKADATFKPDLIIWYKPLDIPDYNKIRTPRCIRYNECWDAKWTAREINKSASELVVCHHYNDIPRLQGHVDPKRFKIVHNPHCAERAIFRPQKRQMCDTLVCGKLSRRFYPLREKLASIIQPGLRTKSLKTVNLSHPGYSLKNLSAVNAQVKKYARELASARIVLTCSSIYRYALAKYIEVPMCGAVLCGDVPGENQDWYRSWMLTVNPEYNAGKIMDVIMSVLRDKTSLKERSERGYREVMRYRTQEDYARRFLSMAELFLNGKLKDYDFSKDAARFLNGGDGEHKPCT